ncbi:hypothetical protein [Streptomyces sp. NPDC057438]|uniref:hypothetical protein n=1 Tax=Streptomyces sp. NPDC057438 TaxID=3346133 RepID=UPI0036A87827
MRTTNTAYQDGRQHPGSDSLEIAKPFVDSGGEDISISMTDVYRRGERDTPGDHLLLRRFTRTVLAAIGGSPHRG